MRCKHCNNVLKEEKTNATHLMFDEEITIQGTPIFVCPSCSHSFYKDPEQLTRNLRDTYRKGEHFGSYDASL